MILQITRIDKVPSKYGGTCYMVLFQDCKTYKSYRTWIYPKMGNFKRWETIIQKGKGTKIEGVRILRKDIIDADSFPRIITEELFKQEVNYVSWKYTEKWIVNDQRIY